MISPPDSAYLPYNKIIELEVYNMELSDLVSVELNIICISLSVSQSSLLDAHSKSSEQLLELLNSSTTREC